ncbi:hypothetical protein BRADI_1g36797v3 [Brachypodium distachyon]|uniref:Uncharacterized protein n=1 Tax=Brachypodium distachyon TaxID=15368 RepID=A0A2K2DN41_BRADI|nr:hypothetical protein BRADI_1g36797v3 [Brachypodium distachyon]
MRLRLSPRPGRASGSHRPGHANLLPPPQTSPCRPPPLPLASAGLVVVVVSNLHNFGWLHGTMLIGTILVGYMEQC